MRTINRHNKQTMNNNPKKICHSKQGTYRKRNVNEMSYELYIPQTYEGRNMVNGRFLKGHTPHNKGKKWSDYLTKRQQRRCAKGWKNVEKFR